MKLFPFKIRRSTLWVARHEIMRMVVGDLLKAQSEIELIRALVLQSDRK